MAGPALPPKVCAMSYYRQTSGSYMLSALQRELGSAVSQLDQARKTAPEGGLAGFLEKAAEVMGLDETGSRKRKQAQSRWHDIQGHRHLGGAKAALDNLFDHFQAMGYDRKEVKSSLIDEIEASGAKTPAQASSVICDFFSRLLADSQHARFLE